MKYRKTTTTISLQLLLVAIAMLFFSALYAQEIPIDTSFSRQILRYEEYIEKVGTQNLGYVAEKFNINIAEAKILSASIFPDPEIGFGWFDNGERRLNMGYGFTSELSWTVELGKKRKARINLAQSEYLLVRYLVQDYFRNLRADATLAYLQALQNRQLLDVQISSYRTIYQLAQSDSIRFKLGIITDIDARQSKLEAQTMLNDVFQAEAEWKTSLATLSILVGTQQTDTLFIPQGQLEKFERSFNLEELITTAQNNRADLLAALQSKRVAQNLLQIAKSNRIPDISISTGVNYVSYVRNIIAPTPSFTSVNVEIAFPLKISNNRPGELQANYYLAQQTDAQYKQVELAIQVEIIQAYFKYLALQKQVEQFKNGLLTEAKAVLDGKIYSYQRGETSLLEVLNAQRTYIGIQQAYYQTLYNYAAALVELERAAGIWDINF